MTSLCSETLRSYPGRPARWLASRRSLQRVGLVRKVGTSRSNSRRAMQESAEVILPTLECQSRREGPNDEEQGGATNELGSRILLRPEWTDPARVDQPAFRLSQRETQEQSVLRFTEPPDAVPHVRWCGEGGQRWPSLPDYRTSPRATHKRRHTSSDIWFW